MSTYGPYTGKLVDWHDGDTAHLDLDVGFGFRVAAYYLDGKVAMRCRVYGIDAPELATPAGKLALAHAEQLCPPGTLVKVLSHGWDRNGGRFDGEIQLPDGTDFAKRMVDGGHAVVAFL